MSTTSAVPKFRLLASGKVQQLIEPGDTTLFDPDLQFRRYADKSGQTVRAVQIPGTFIVGGDCCRDGYLVLADTGLKAISTHTFQKDYSAVLELDAA